MAEGLPPSPCGMGRKLPSPHLRILEFSSACCLLVFNCSLLFWSTLPLTWVAIPSHSSVDIILGTLWLWVAGAPEVSYSYLILGEPGTAVVVLQTLPLVQRLVVKSTTILTLTISAVSLLPTTSQSDPFSPQGLFLVNAASLASLARVFICGSSLFGASNVAIE